LSVMTELLDLLVSSIQGLVAHLALCLSAAGHGCLADPLIARAAVRIQVPDLPQSCNPQELAQVMRVAVGADDHKVFVLGIPGSNSSGRLALHANGGVETWADVATV